MRHPFLSALLAVLAAAGCDSSTAPLVEAPGEPTSNQVLSGIEGQSVSPGTLVSLGSLDGSAVASSSTQRQTLDREAPVRFNGTRAKALVGGINPVVQEAGKISLSIDGMGTTGTAGIVTIVKPAGATVRGAYVATASNWFVGPQPNGSVSINGSPVTWQQTVHINPPASHWADVTAIVKPTLDAAPAGSVNVGISETTALEGTILAVIFDDPNQTTDNTVALLFGAQRLSGDNFYLGLAEPLDTSDPNLVMDMSLGISFGFQSGSFGTQHSIVDVNGARLTTSAGGQDDGMDANGALLTVGGFGDTNANPVPATSFCGNGPRCDDELYNLVPLLATGTQQITVFTRNPSNDDNLFFAAFFLSVSAQVATQEPIANAGPDQTVEAPNSFDLNGSGSFDGDGTIVSYQWTEGGNPIGNTAVISGLVRPVGTHTFVLRVEDDDGLSDEDMVVVEVVPPADASPPVIAYALNGTLGDNGWYVGPVTITWTVTDDESAVTSTNGCEEVTTSTDGTGYSFTCSATSAGGTSEVTSDAFDLDQTAPTLSYALSGTQGDNGWYVGPVTVEWSSSDALSGIADSCPDETQSADGTDHTFSCSVSDNAGNETSATTDPFDLDQTAPTVTYAGNVGSYDVSGVVEITCSATDDLSGVASDTCADIEGEAWTFGLGTHTFSAGATDAAGNAGSASTSFDVSVSWDGLCTLVQSFVSHAGVANSLCVKLEAAERAETRGQTSTRDNVLDAFINEVEAQSGKKVPAAAALVLIDLANALMS